MAGWCKGLFLCLDGLELGQAEVAGLSRAALGGGVDDNGLKQSLGAVGHFVAQPLPSAPGVGFLSDPGGGLGSVAGLGIGQAMCSALAKLSTPLRKIFQAAAMMELRLYFFIWDTSL